MSRKRNTDLIKNCEKCGGKGYLRIKEDDEEYNSLKEMYGTDMIAGMASERCECLLEVQFQQWVGGAIYNAEDINETGLLDRLDDDLFIRASHQQFLAHWKRILREQEFTFFWRLVTDSKMRDIFVGNDEKFHALSSLVRNPELLVIRMGVLSYKNVAMPGLILEALKIRQFEDKPTWVVNDPDNPFKKGHLAWSGELEYFLEQNFDTIVLKNASNGSNGNKGKNGEKDISDINDISL